MEMQSVLIVPLIIETLTWGLIEVYDTRTRVFSGVERYLAELAATHVGALVAGFEHEERAQRLYRETLASLSNALEAKDAVTSQHTEEVVRLAVGVAAELELELEAVRNVELGAVLHDIGKVRVPESILNKPGPLTEKEWAVMKTHPEIGEHILRPIQSLHAILPIVRHHHERWDGTGYPDGLSGRAIPLGARIVAVCDAYRAMTEDRPYRAALSTSEARDELEAGAGTQFDADCVKALFKALVRRDSFARRPATRRSPPFEAYSPARRKPNLDENAPPRSRSSVRHPPGRSHERRCVLGLAVRHPEPRTGSPQLRRPGGRACSGSSPRGSRVRLDGWRQDGACTVDGHLPWLPAEAIGPRPDRSRRSAFPAHGSRAPDGRAGAEDPSDGGS
jgi:putative nucleotidyltransferase with HDIG domain